MEEEDDFLYGQQEQQVTTQSTPKEEENGGKLEEDQVNSNSATTVNTETQPKVEGAEQANDGGGGGEEEEEEEEEDDVEILLSTEINVEKGSFPKTAFYRSAGAKQAAHKYASVGGTPSGSTPGSVGTPNSSFQSPQQGGTTPMRALQGVGGSNLLNANLFMQSQGGPSPIVAQNQRNVIDLDLDSLEDKPWRKSGVDITDYFNYGFNEDTWRQYCTKQVQLRLEQSMQGKIKVYESKQTDQKPDLPPELLALTESDKKRKYGGGPRRGRESPPPEWLPGGYDHRRRGRDQDDSVIQVLASGDPGAEGSPKDRDRSGSHSPRYFERRRDEERRREEDRRREYDRRDDRRSDRRDYDRDRDHRDDYRSSSPSHKRAKDSSSKREEDDRSKRRR